MIICRSEYEFECEGILNVENCKQRERNKTADFKRDQTADFQNRAKHPILKLQNRRLVKIKIADFVNA